MKKDTQTLGTMLVLLSVLMFGSYGVWSRLIGGAMDNFFQGWTRALIILVLLLPIVLIRKEVTKIKREDWKWLTLFLFFTSLTQAPVFYAFNHMDIGSASLLFFSSMFLTMNVVGVLFLGEKVTAVTVISAVLALFGMYFVFSFSVSAFAWLAVLMAVVNGIASGGEVAFSKKLTDKYSALYLVVLSWVIILITNCLISLLIGESMTSLSVSLHWLWQFLYSIASLLGFWLVIAGFKYVSAGVGALLGLLEIVVSVALGIVIFGESLSTNVMIGSLLIIVAAALPNIYDLKFKKSVI